MALQQVLLPLLCLAAPLMLLLALQSAGAYTLLKPHAVTAAQQQHQTASSSSINTSRREVLFSLLPATAGAAFAAAAVSGGAAPAAAADGATAGKRLWLSGKSAGPKTDDKAGTKKDSKYLRCLSNCLAGCQKPSYDGERDRDECLQRCQDECCFSYAQCTYPVAQNK